MAVEPSEAQAVAVFTASGEAHRFLVGQMWQVTYFALLAHGALAAAPTLIGDDGGVWVAVNWFCAFVAAGIAVLASIYLLSLYEADAKRLKEVYAAGKELQLVLALHKWTGAPEPNRWLNLVLVVAVCVGALLVIVINLSRIL